jgi:multidrug resistance efflux pump
MIIILCLYIVALWVVFSKFKLVRWGWLSGTVSVLVGVFILAIFLALFNYLTPSGRVTVAGRVVEVTPNVTGQIISIPVKPNVPVKANDVLFPGAVSIQGVAAASVARLQQSNKPRY